MSLIATSWVTAGVVTAAWVVVAAFLYVREVRKKRDSAETGQSSLARSDDDPNPLRNHSELVFRVVFLIGVALFAPKWLGSGGWGWNVQSVVVASALVGLVAWIGTDYVLWRRRRVQRSG